MHGALLVSLAYSGRRAIRSSDVTSKFSTTQTSDEAV
jgi:hypothetical protein